MIEATRFGRPLAEGGCVGVPAPASPWENRSDLLRGVEWWRARGPGDRPAGWRGPVAAAAAMGTPWEPELDGAILFFEDFEAPPWYVDGMLTQLGQAGKLAQVVGVVVGDMEKCDWSEQRPEWPRTKSLEQVLEEHLEPLGVTATLDADARTLTLDDPALR